MLFRSRVLEPYIRISGNEPAVKQPVPEVRSTAFEAKEVKAVIAKSLFIELNTADSSLLTQLSGIGPVLASRTIRYRNRMGGFADVAQIGEVYGINAELVERLATQLSADSSLIRKIPVNTATFRDLISHPYLNEQQVRGVLNYRKLQNRIHHMDELVQNNILKREEAEKIRPYLKYD